MIRGRAAVTVGIAVLTLVGCAHAGRSAGTAGCAPGAAGSVDIADLQGTFRLTLVNASGDSTSGALRLVPQADTLQHIEGAPQARMPLIGTVRIDLSEVDAVAMRGLDSSDPLAPGVAVVAGPEQVVVRFGADQNRRGERSFDAGSMALFVAATDGGGFHGRWISSVELTRVTGHFCATRTNED